MEKYDILLIIYNIKTKKIIMKTMEEKKKQRKPGTGLWDRSGIRYLKDFYKVYALVHPETEEYFYVGLTKQYLCKRLAYHIYCVTKLKHDSPRDEYIRGLLEQGMKPKIVLLEKLETTNLNEARLKENEYISKYGIKNSFSNVFKGKRRTGPSENIYEVKIKKLIDEGKIETEIIKETGFNQSVVNYYMRKYKVDKKIKMAQENKQIVELLKLGYRYSRICRVLGMTYSVVYTRIKRYELLKMVG